MSEKDTDNTLTQNDLDRYEEWSHPIQDFTQIVPADSGGVYRVQTTSGTKYLRVLESSPIERIDKILQSDTLFGFPPSKLLRGSPPILMMDEAPGRPLSRVYPIVTVPLFWWYFGPNIRIANERLGTYLGRLHRETIAEVRPIQETSFEKYRTNMDGIERVLDDALVSQLHSVANRLDGVELTAGIVHGDPTPHNLFYRNGDLTLIDFSLDPDAVVRDVINAERGIELMIGRLPHGRSSQRETLVDAFRTGYQEAYPAFQRPEKFNHLQCLSDAYLLSLQLDQSFDKPGAKIAQRTDVKLLADRLRSALR